MRGLYNLRLVFYAWLGHFVKLLQVKLAQAVSPASSPPFLSPEQSVFLPVARSAKWSSSKTLLDGPVMIPPETHSKIIHKRHLSQDTLHRCPWQDPLTQPDVVYARLLGQRSVFQLLSCPLMGAVPTDVPICALRCWRVKTKHPSQVFQVSSGKQGREKHQWVWERPSHRRFFQISMGFFVSQFFASDCTG